MIKLKSLLIESIIDSPQFKRWFGNSKVVDKNNAPLVVYHGTVHNTEILNFHPYTHLGSLSQAKQFSWDIQRGHKIYEVYLSIQNPKRCGDMFADSLKTVGADEDENYAKKYWLRQIKLAKKEGFDGIVYDNEYEGGGDSWIIFKPTQIKSAINNNGQFDSNNPDITKENK